MCPSELQRIDITGAGTKEWRRGGVLRRVRLYCLAASSVYPVTANVTLNFTGAILNVSDEISGNVAAYSATSRTDITFYPNMPLEFGRSIIFSLTTVGIYRTSAPGTADLTATGGADLIIEVET